jgi:hypothetical protein
MVEDLEGIAKFLNEKPWQLKFEIAPFFGVDEVVCHYRRVMIRVHPSERGDDYALRMESRQVCEINPCGFTGRYTYSAKIDDLYDQIKKFCESQEYKIETEHQMSLFDF